MDDPVMLRELLLAYAETFKMGVEMATNNKNFGFWRPWLDTGKFFEQLAPFCKKKTRNKYNVLVVFVCASGKEI